MTRRRDSLPFGTCLPRATSRVVPRTCETLGGPCVAPFATRIEHSRDKSTRRSPSFAILAETRGNDLDGRLNFLPQQGPRPIAIVLGHDGQEKGSPAREDLLLIARNIVFDRAASLFLSRRDLVPVVQGSRSRRSGISFFSRRERLPVATRSGSRRETPIPRPRSGSYGTATRLSDLARWTRSSRRNIVLLSRWDPPIAVPTCRADSVIDGRYA